MIKTIAIDDEPLALQLIAGYIKKTPFLEFIEVFDNPLSAMEYIEKNEVDLIFLDIQMPDLLGTEFARIITGETKFIFTTAYEKYALEGFKLDAVDYLLKPFGYEEFLTSANKARKLIELQQKADASNTSLDANSDFLFLKADYKIRRINYDEILYIEGLKDYIKIYLKTDPKPIISHYSLKLLEAKLPESRFMRIHRSFIVNLQCVNTVDRFRIVFGKEYLPISDQYKDKFQKFLDENFI
ncbi:MAG TPA: LytTR family DNA-binding domain-containing protein [Bacteroidales bacterium]|nr:LytTR family DNA-binding domain-containing protein [Bacteroidales bacterium]